MHSFCSRSLLTAVVLSGGLAMAGEWPMYRGDPGRRGVTSEVLALPLTPTWRYRCAQRPQPAWPEPVKNLNRTDFDYAPQPIIAGGMLFFASSADDTVRALDAATGVERWHFITGGPVRLPPQASSGRLYFGSDDGYVYCLDAASGALQWRYRPLSQDEFFVGNERVISRWPIRTGVLVADGMVYFCAGIWPSEGIYLCCLDAAEGTPIWINDTCGTIFARIVGHNHEVSQTGINPQGALAATAQHLIVPMGRAAPAVFDRNNGELLHYAPGLLNGTGGSWLAVDNDIIYTYAKSFYSPLSVKIMPIAELIGMTEKQSFTTFRPPASSRFFRALQYSLYDDKVSTVVADGKVASRVAFGLLKADQMLLLGHRGRVTAVGESAPAAELWHGEVAGRAYELAAADGCLFVATDEGEITCFAGGKEGAGVAPTEPPSAQPPAVASAALYDWLTAAGMTKGYAVVIGDAEAKLARALARRTGLKIVMPVSDPAVAQAMRERLLTETDLYGSRIQVQTVAGAKLPFAHYFANAVIVAGLQSEVPAAELARVLRPCGGVLAFPDWQPAAAKAFVEPVADTAQLAQLADAPAWQRGRLPGAWDWDSPARGAAAGDQLVCWPLRPIWFGGPGPAYLFNRKYRAPTLTAADGRFVVFGDRRVFSIDAYNGVLLWERATPFLYRGGGGVSAKADKVYVSMSAAVFRARDKGVIVLAAATGAQQQIFVDGEVPPVVDLGTAPQWTLENEGQQFGTVNLQAATKGLQITLGAAPPPSEKHQMVWDLFFDFREAPARFGLYDDRVIHLQVKPANADGRPPAWQAITKHPDLEAELLSSYGDSGSKTTLTLAWPWPEPSFGFAAGLTAEHQDQNQPSIAQYLFTNAFGDGINNGWMNICRDAAQLAAHANLPAIVVGAVERETTDPAEAALNVLPDSVRRAQQPAADVSVVRGTRIHPLTGERVRMTMARGDGCSGIGAFATGSVYRAGNAAIYDFADDSGARVFPGVRPSCGTSMMAAHGVWYMSSGGAGCECTYNLLTDIGLAGAERRLQEDWALFGEWQVDTLVRQAHLNLGAPGDRRDEQDRLWLFAPRPHQSESSSLVPVSATWMPGFGIHQQRKFPTSIEVPVTFELMPGGGPRRVNADRVEIHGTALPWVYASQLEGLASARLQLSFLPSLTAVKAASAVDVDGRLDDAAWPADAQLVLAETEAQIYTCFDDDQLYVGGRRPALPDRKGQIRKWQGKAVNEMAQGYHFDDVWELFISDRNDDKVLHLAITAGGIRRDAVATGRDKESLRWSGDWLAAVQADEAAFAAEFAIPWQLLADLGLDRQQLAINVQVGNHPKVAEAIVRLGAQGRERCGNFVPLGLGSAPVVPRRRYTVRLHFAELDDLAVGQRQFAVSIQGQAALPTFDIVAVAGAARTAVVRTFSGVAASDALTVSLAPLPGSSRPPLLSALEVDLEPANP